MENEDITAVILQVLRNELLMDHLKRADINVCHRLGGKRRDRQGNDIERPIICKFMSRSVKREIKQTCLDTRVERGQRYGTSYSKNNAEHHYQ